MASHPQRVAKEESAGSGKPRRHRRFQAVLGDVEIFKHLSDYRLLQRDHLSALTGRDPKRLHRRIVKLLEHGYLKRIPLPLTRHSHVYYLGPAAIPALLAHGILDERDAEKRSREHELKSVDYLDHELMITTVHIILELAGRSSHVKLREWRQGKEELTDSTTGIQGAATLCPDAFFILEDTKRPAGENRRGFFLEADRSSMSRAGRMTEKYARYRDYIGHNRHEPKYGIQSVRVVTVTETRARAESLCSLVSETVPRNFQRYFRFGTLEDFSLENPSGMLDAVFMHPHDHGKGARHALMPPPQPLQMPAHGVK